MAYVPTTYRPTQSHLEYVYMNRGEKRRNRAYVPDPTRTPKQGFPDVDSRPLTGRAVDAIHSDQWQTRRGIARRGMGLDILMNDPRYEVRKAVVRQGYKLDHFIHDKDENIRALIAEQGYGLDELVNDPHWYVRECVANHGFEQHLEKLIHDPSPLVRAKVAEQSYRLDILVHDTDPVVKHIAEVMSGPSVEELYEQGLITDNQ